MLLEMIQILGLVEFLLNFLEAGTEVFYKYHYKMMQLSFQISVEESLNVEREYVSWNDEAREEN